MSGAADGAADDTGCVICGQSTAWVVELQTKRRDDPPDSPFRCCYRCNRLRFRRRNLSTWNPALLARHGLKGANDGG